MDMSRSRRVGRPVLVRFPSIRGTVAILVGLSCGGLLDSRAMAQAPARSGSRFIPNDSDDGRATPAERGQPRAGPPVVRGDRHLSAGDRAVRRQGRQAARRTSRARTPSGEFVLYVDVRRFCQRRLAQLPPEARAIYRNRVDGAGRALVSPGGRAAAISGLLRRVVDQAFCSSWGDDALELLGDLAFQDGRFDEALATVPPARPRPARRPVRPGPSRSLGRPGAGRGQEAALPRGRGRQPPSRADLDAFARRFPGRDGPLAGRKGRYATILAEALAARSPGPRRPSPTAAGRPSPARRRGPRSSPGRSTSGSLQWRVELEQVSHGRAGDHVRRRCAAPTSGRRDRSGCWPTTRSCWATR